MTILDVQDLAVQRQAATVLRGVSFRVQTREQWAVTGPSGSGKTTLLQALAGRLFHKGSIEVAPGHGMVLVEQQHRFKNLSNTADFYYQQRFNSADAEDTISVADYLQAHVHNNGLETELVQEVWQLLHLEQLKSRRLIQLSNGENKRLQLAKALLLQPRILLLDNPYLGLDAEARNILEHLLQVIAGKGIHIILVTTRQELPSFITNVLALSGGGAHACTVSEWRTLQAGSSEPAHQLDEALLQQLTGSGAEVPFEFAVRMKNVQVRYGEKVILDGVSWEVRKGAHWSLSGPNGAGKSTLLSLINADNPQAYANEIYLFDQRRGKGESIWDIKKRIGYVSPELHLYFESTVTAFEAVASGLFDTIGLFRPVSEAQRARVLQWMHLLNVQLLQHRLLAQLSASQQRLVLLARALVKNPSLLILDEPTQGLDDGQVAVFKDIIDQIGVRTHTTIIYVSHYAEDVPGCVNHFIRLEEGKVVALG